MKYDITYKCGHTGVIELYGKNTDRERQIRRMECCDCPDCQAKTAREAVAADEANMLPALTGTEKQIAWATTIRRTFLNNYDAFLERRIAEAEAQQKKCTEGIARCEKTKEIILKKTKSSWWIERNRLSVEALLSEVYRENIGNTEASPEREENKQQAIDAAAEAIVSPENRKSDTIAEIAIINGCATVRSVIDDNLRNIVKSRGFAWDRDCKAWVHPSGDTTGDPKDRAAEIGNALLLAGFRVRIYDDELRKAAVEAKFIPKCDRWIVCTGKGYRHEGWFAIMFPRGDEELYKKARLLPQSKWDSPAVIVPPEYYNQVEDFAEVLGFEISPAAKKLIAEYREIDARAVKPSEPAPAPVPEDKLANILKSSREVLEDLRDDV